MLTAQVKNNIQKLRVRLGVNPVQLAAALETIRTYLSKLENQKFSPGSGLMAKICKYFNKQLGEVFYIE